MSLEQLWNGWRAEYIGTANSNSTNSAQSVFTTILNSGLSDEEAFIVHRSSLSFAILNAYNPDALNVGINLGQAAGGSIAQHLHVHVVPRWNGDSNFMTSVANTRTIPEPLPLTASKIRDAWPKEKS